MTTSEFKQEALKRIDRIPPERYQSVLAQLDHFGERPRGTPLKDLAKFAGTISQETAEEMKRVIEEECERIDYESWGLPAGHEHRDRPAAPAADELDAIRAYAAAKASGDEAIPLEDALREIERDRQAQ